MRSKRLTSLKRDLISRYKFGKVAPYFGQAIYINPQTCNTFFSDWDRKHSGTVKDGDWDLAVHPLIEYPKYKHCIDHWVKGVSWKDAGAYDFLRSLIKQRGVPIDGCFTEEEIINRYDKLDKIFEQVSRAGELYPRKKVNPHNFRESGGVYFHIDRNNMPVFGTGGAHRFAMSKILNFSIIPAQLGVVHKAAVNDWVKYKTPPK